MRKNLTADVLKTVEEVSAFSEKFMQFVAVNDMKTAFENAKPYVPISQTEIDATYLQLKSNRDMVLERFGKTIGYEFISIKKLGTSLIRLQYIEKTPKTLLPWTFVFYNPGNGWFLNSVFCDSSTQNLFKDN